jgi:hypothetical protein
MKNKYLKENFEPIVKVSKNITEILLKLEMNGKGDTRKTIRKYINLYNIDISHFETQLDRYNRTLKKNIAFHKIPIKNILISNSTYSCVSLLKKRLYNEGLKERKCELCGQDENWRGEHMSLILDHINGINNDHKIENLRIVCPNCNATLPTYCRGIKGINKKGTLKNNKNFNHYEHSVSQRKTQRPSYEQLQKEIKENGYSATGGKYGVSDNAIRKWIKFYEKFNVL